MKNLLLIAITILAVGCGGKNESTTDTKPVEEKVLEVKEEVKTEEPIAEVQPELEGVNRDELEFREGIQYLKGSDTPYTGKTFVLHENGQKSGEANYKDGKADGLGVSWYKNGQKSSETNMKDGKLDGLFFGWHEGGQKKVEGNFKDGKLDGLAIGWYKNGQKKSEENYKDGKKLSAKYWNSKGEYQGVNYDEFEFRERIAYLKGSDIPYTGKVFNLYKNGQKAAEVNYKAGKPEGLWVVWYKNGQKAAENNWKDGKMDGLETLWHENGQKQSEGNYKNGKKISGKYWNSKGEPVDTREEAEKE
jgi:antitoxin component YwqK of YwqJK toxin-antitoxin module